MSHPPFSVSMCVYGGDRPDWFRAAVNSVLDQTCPPDEVVLVVDGPVPPELDAVIRGYEARPDFRVLRQPENLGHGPARRLGLKACRHALAALMDADDLSEPRRFETQLELFAQDPELAAVGGFIAEFAEDPEHFAGIRPVALTDEAIKADLKVRCPMNQVTVMLRRDLAEQAGGYLDWYCEEDYYLWLRMALAGMRFANSPDVLVRVRVGQEMYRRRGGWPYFASEARFQRLLLSKRVIGPGRFLVNVAKRLVVQVLLPDRLRGWVFQTFARSGEETA